MDINAIPEAFQSRIRIAVISCLITGEKTFNQLKETTKATDGNLSVHLTKLEEMGYLKVDKAFVGKKPCTTYTLTPQGRQDFESYVRNLEGVLKSIDASL